MPPIDAATRYATTFATLVDNDRFAFRECRQLVKRDGWPAALIQRVGVHRRAFHQFMHAGPDRTLSRSAETLA